MIQRSVQVAAVVGALLLGATPGVVSAVPLCASGTLQPGAPDECTGTVYAPNSAEANFSGNMKTLRFKVYWSATVNGPFSVIEDFEAVAATHLWPESDATKIPGYFYICAKRPARFSSPADYDLCITGQ